MVLKLAFRNIFRHKRRNLLTFTPISIGIFMMVLSMGMMMGIGSQSERNIIDNQTAHLKIFNPDYWENREILPLNMPSLIPGG